MSNMPLKTPVEFDAIPLVNVHAALIDLDDTLYAYPPAHAKAMAAVFEKLPFETTYSEFENFYRVARDKVVGRLSPQGACRSRLLAFQDMCEERKVSGAFHAALSLDELYWRSFIATITLDSGASRFIDRCRTASIRICVVSNMVTSWQVLKLERLGLRQKIDFLVTSEEVGHEKPDPRMYQAALHKLKLDASDVIMVGDDWKNDIAGAERVGIKAFYVRVGTA